MERWTGKTVLVTGASAGIGLATAQALAKQGMKVIACARNIDTLLDSNKSGGNQIDAIKCDLTKENEVVELFKQIGKKYGSLNVLINNAGMAGIAPLSSGSTDIWRNIVELNVIGLSVCTREALKLMEPDNASDRQIINVNSYIGHHMPKSPPAQFYSASKHMTVALTEALRKDCQAKNIRVTSLSPGLTETEFAIRASGDPESAARAYGRFKCLEAWDVAQAVVSILSFAKHVNVEELTLTGHQQDLI